MKPNASARDVLKDLRNELEDVFTDFGEETGFSFEGEDWKRDDLADALLSVKDADDDDPTDAQTSLALERMTDALIGSIREAVLEKLDDMEGEEERESLLFGGD